MLLKTEEDQILTIFNLEILNKEDSYEREHLALTLLLFCFAEQKLRKHLDLRLRQHELSHRVVK